MDATRWALYVVAAALAMAAVGAVYRFREPPGRGRPVLVTLRWLAVATLLLLLFNPVVPEAGAGAPRRALLLDGSMSMRLSGAAGVSAWRAALDSLGGAADTVLVFGEGVHAVPLDSMAEATPIGTRSRLAPAVRAAAEAGATRATVWTDGRLEDAREAVRVARALGLSVQLHRVQAMAAVNRAVTEIDAPARARAGERLVVGFGVEASTAAGAGDSLSVVLRADGRTVARARLAAPGPGRVATGTLTWQTRDRRGPVRLDVALEGDDGFPEDDVRTAYVDLTERPAEIVLVSLAPDWEPRFLAPALERSLGLDVAGYLRLASGGWLKLGAGTDAGEIASAAETRSAAASARFLVVHEPGDAPPDWLAAAARNAPRLLMLPGNGAVVGAPLRLAGAMSGEWYLLPEPPPSPVAGLLGGIDATGLPPLRLPREPQDIGNAWTALRLSPGRGRTAPALVAGEDGRRRWAVATASGFWRWAFHDQRGRRLYDRFWSAIAGWLAEEDDDVTAAAVRPVSRVVPRGAPVAFLSMAPVDSLRIRITDAEGALAMDTTVAMHEDEASLASLAPGNYRYRVSATAPTASADAALSGEGPLTVEQFLPELTRPVVEALEGAVPAVGAGAGAGAGQRPFRTLAWPYVLLVALLALEWTLRRWWGLR